MLIGPLWGSVVARLGHPLLVLPLVELVGDHRGGGRGDLGGAGHRVGLLVPGAVGEADLELVAGADPTPGTKSSHTPDDPSERIAVAVPSQ